MADTTRTGAQLKTANPSEYAALVDGTVYTMGLDTLRGHITISDGGGVVHTASMRAFGAALAAVSQGTLDEIIAKLVDLHCPV